MMFSEEFLRAMCAGRVSGDFPPFDAGKIEPVEDYIGHILGAVNARKDLIVKADFDSYGSGFASYVSVRISKKDKSDTRITNKGALRTEWTDGLLLYVSKLAPFWFWGGSDWTINYEGERETGGAGGFLSPESVHDLNRDLWDGKIGRIEKVFADFGYVLLKENELNEPLRFEIKIPTILAGERYLVFDCFFYWED
jgi:hypothetical protein